MAGPGLNSHLTLTPFTAAGMFILGFEKPPCTLTLIVFQFSGTLRRIPRNVDGERTTAPAGVAAFASKTVMLLLLNLNQWLFWTAGDLSKGHKSSLRCRGACANTRRILPRSISRMVCLGKTTRHRAHTESQACKEWAIFNEPVCAD